MVDSPLISESARRRHIVRPVFLGASMYRLSFLAVFGLFVSRNIPRSCLSIGAENDSFDETKAPIGRVEVEVKGMR